MAGRTGSTDPGVPRGVPGHSGQLEREEQDVTQRAAPAISWAHKNAAQSILDSFPHLALACRDADSELFAGGLRSSN